MRKVIVFLVIMVFLGSLQWGPLPKSSREVIYHKEKITVITLGNISIWMGYVSENTIPIPPATDWNVTDTYFIVIDGNGTPLARFGMYIPNPSGAFMKTSSASKMTVKTWFENRFGAFLGTWINDTYAGYAPFEYAVDTVSTMIEYKDGLVEYFDKVANGSITPGERTLARFVGYLSEGTTNWIIFGTVFENKGDGSFNFAEIFHDIKFSVNSTDPINITLSFPHQNITHVSGASIKGEWNVELITTTGGTTPSINVNYYVPFVSFPQLVVWRTLNSTVYSSANVYNVTVFMKNIGGTYATNVNIEDPSPDLPGMELVSGNNTLTVSSIAPGQELNYSYLLNISSPEFSNYLLTLPQVTATYLDGDGLQQFVTNSSENHIIDANGILNSTLKSNPRGFPDVILNVYHDHAYNIPENYTFALKNTGADSVNISLQFNVLKVINAGDGLNQNNTVEFNFTLSPYEERNLTCTVLYAPGLKPQYISLHITLNPSNFYMVEYKSKSATWYAGHEHTGEVALNITRIYDPYSSGVHVNVSSILPENTTVTFIQPLPDTYSNLTSTMIQFNVSRNQPWTLFYNASPTYKVLMPAVIYYDNLSHIANIYDILGIEIDTYIYTPPDAMVPYIEFVAYPAENSTPIPGVPATVTLEIRNPLHVGIDKIVGEVRYREKVILNITIHDLVPSKSIKYNVTITYDREGDAILQLKTNITFIKREFTNIAMGASVEFRYPPPPPQTYAWVVWLVLVAVLSAATVVIWRKERRR